LRRRADLTAGRKVLIVLDQFEQWLHGRSLTERSELVEALRQCDGQRVLCLLTVRDDFWLVLTRFMADLEVDMTPHRNTALVDLFEPRHARKVLAAFGCAFETLPADAKQWTAEHEQFLDQAVAGLTQGGKIVCVRLALPVRGPVARISISRSGFPDRHSSGSAPATSRVCGKTWCLPQIQNDRSLVQTSTICCLSFFLRGRLPV
jgi:hypothetical protein